MPSHQRKHVIIAEPLDEFIFICKVCAQVVVEIDSPNFRPFYRHKPSGYKWGDASRRYLALYIELKARVKTLPKEYHHILEGMVDA